MASEQANDFNKRLSQWVASQGFWFQLRYSLSGSGMRGRAMFHLMRMVFRVVVFGLVMMAISWVYLLKRTESTGFATEIKEQIKDGISGKELALRGLSYSQGQLEIPRLAAEGGNGTFFQTMEVVSLRCKMTLLDGLVGVWEPGVIGIAKLDLDLRAGADDDESAAELSKVIFDQSEKVRVNSFEVGNINLHWGYSERNQGSIIGSSMRANRTSDGWRLTFKGGRFSQNWLSDLDIKSLIVMCEPDLITFRQAEFEQAGGTVDFTGLKVHAGSRPRIEGMVELHKMRLDRLLPGPAADLVEGTLSTRLSASGSTNTSEGIQFAGQVVLDGEDVITLRDRLPVLTALSVMDYSRNYHRIDFQEGAFKLNIGGGGMKISDLKLNAGDLFTLVGGLEVRLPTQEEIEKVVEQGRASRLSGVVGQDPYEDLLSVETEFSLRRAAMEARRQREDEKAVDTFTLFDRLSFNADMRTLEVAAGERMSRMLQYEGEFEISIPGDAFERARELQDDYPINPDTGRIAIDVPVQGHLYQLTEKQAAEIYERGRRL